MTPTTEPTTRVERPTPMVDGGGLARLLVDRARVSGDRTALTWQPFDGPTQHWTYRDLVRDVSATAAGLRARGTVPGDRILLHLENCPEFIVAWLACAATGAVAVATNTRSTDDELAHYIGDAAIVAIITQPKFAARLSRLAGDARWLVSTTHDAGAAPRPGTAPHPAASFEQLQADPNDFDLSSATTDLAAPLCIQYTSGTTSRPKGVLWTHANGMWAARTNAGHEGLTPDDVYLCYLPLFHTNALAYTVLASLWVGAQCVLTPKWSTSRFWDISLVHRCTITNTVGLTMRAIAGTEAPGTHHYRLFGTGVCDTELDAALGIKSLGWWGMTETVSHPIVGDVYTPNRPWSMGRPAPEYRVAIVDDAGRHVRHGETGRLFVRGRRGVSLFAEYLNNPQATAAAFTDDGWFDTGDRVAWHDDGHISFADRSKDMLRVGGENVAASEIERAALAVPGVGEAAAVGRPDADLDEVPVLFVLADQTLIDQTSPDRAATEDIAAAVLAACRRTLADFKVPREIRVVDSLPRSTLEKIDKAALRRSVVADGPPPVTP